MNTDEIIETRLDAMDLDMKQIFELLLSINSEREFIQRMLYLKKQKTGKKL